MLKQMWWRSHDLHLWWRIWLRRAAAEVRSSGLLVLVSVLWVLEQVRLRVGDGRRAANAEDGLDGPPRNGDSLCNPRATHL